jgi:hypothetical protein
VPIVELSIKWRGKGCEGRGGRGGFGGGICRGEILNLLLRFS